MSRAKVLAAVAVAVVGVGVGALLIVLLIHPVDDALPADTTMFHATAGTLPTAGTRELAGIALPPGRVVTAENRGGAAVAWISDDVLPADRLNELIRGLAAAFPHTGLWPMRAEGLDGKLERPWGSGEMNGPEAVSRDTLTLLTEHGATDGAVPAVGALAAAAPGPDLVPSSLQAVDGGGLLLVSVARPADVPAALGWWGGVNYNYTGADFSTVLRSWEDRFGAVLVSIGFDTMRVQVARRPQSTEQADTLLREHYAFCPDNIDQGVPAEAFRDGLLEWTHWNFWWD